MFCYSELIAASPGLDLVRKALVPKISGLETIWSIGYGRRIFLSGITLQTTYANFTASTCTWQHVQQHRLMLNSSPLLGFWATSCSLMYVFGDPLQISREFTTSAQWEDLPTHTARKESQARAGAYEWSVFYSK